MVPPLQGSNEAVGGGGGEGLPNLFSCLYFADKTDDMSRIHVSWCKFSFLKDFFFLFARTQNLVVS